MGVQVGGLDVVTLLGAIAGLPLLGAIAGAHAVGCHCWAPLLGIGGGGCTSWRIGCGDVAS